MVDFWPIFKLAVRLLDDWLGLLGVIRKSPAVGRATELCPVLTETFMSLQGDLHSMGWRQMSLLRWGGVKNPPGGAAQNSKWPTQKKLIFLNRQFSIFFCENFMD